MKVVDAYWRKLTYVLKSLVDFKGQTISKKLKNYLHLCKWFDTGQYDSNEVISALLTEKGKGCHLYLMHNNNEQVNIDVSLNNFVNLVNTLLVPFEVQMVLLDSRCYFGNAYLIIVMCWLMYINQYVDKITCDMYMICNKLMLICFWLEIPSSAILKWHQPSLSTTNIEGWKKKVEAYLLELENGLQYLNLIEESRYEDENAYYVIVVDRLGRSRLFTINHIGPSKKVVVVSENETE
ncbi:hypothetical protein H5410_056281 [Solanum commersonii]|uniref:Uncharacterized protein n=1 Tax=Solanum commersonii TaxID=4109 RepID=A0A9J5WJV0_SOLCO|nr:hypothetical protein H5410_056281 [Solanum commersonii]